MNRIVISLPFTENCGFSLKITVPLKERCPLCRSFPTLRSREKVDQTIDIDEVSAAEYSHDEYWLNQRDLVRTMHDLVEDYIDEELALDGGCDSDDILFSP